jgi:surface antigen
MNPLLLTKTTTSMKTAVVITLGIIAMICFLPMLAVVAMAAGSTVSPTGTVYNGPGNTADTYAFGNCTWWVFLLRAQANEAIPNNWGNAATWASNAKADGYLVNQTPTVGAIMQTANSDGGIGHVAYVKSVNPVSGAWTISEMNVAGWDMTDERTLPAMAAYSYNFIHDKAGL